MPLFLCETLERRAPPFPVPGRPGCTVICEYLGEETNWGFTESPRPPFPQWYQLGAKDKSQRVCPWEVEPRLGAHVPSTEGGHATVSCSTASRGRLWLWCGRLRGADLGLRALRQSAGFLGPTSFTSLLKADEML